MDKNHIIAIDGYSSCGKSTLAKALAKRLEFTYIDSGAMYRAVTLHLLREKIDINDTEAIAHHVSHIKIEFKNFKDQNLIYLNGEDVSEEIRRMDVSEKVSLVSPIPAVRKVLISQQQEMGKNKSIVMDGRDIGTKVFPDATIKLFMTADPKIRANRRFAELTLKDKEVSLEDVFNNLTQRDHNDTCRTESPLICAQEAIIIDNTKLSRQEQFDITLNKVLPLLDKQII